MLIADHTIAVGADGYVSGWRRPCGRTQEGSVMDEPMACLPLFDWSPEEESTIRELRDAIRLLPSILRKEVVGCVFECLPRFWVEGDGVGAVRALDETKAKVVEFYRDLLSALRASDEDAIRRVAHGGSFREEIEGGTAILVACEPPPSNPTCPEIASE